MLEPQVFTFTGREVLSSPESLSARLPSCCPRSLPVVTTSVASVDNIAKLYELHWTLGIKGLDKSKFPRIYGAVQTEI